MASEKGDLIYQVPLRAFLPIEHWMHLFVANNIFGLFAEGARTEDAIKHLPNKLRILAAAMLEQKQVLSCSALVRMGRNVHIDPTAVIQGPTVIGDNVTIGAGAVIDVCQIGSNVTVSQGCHLMLSVVSDGCFLPFRAALFMTSLMENSMVAQNTCLQLCVIGRNSFVGAGTTFTDFNLLPTPLRALYDGKLVPTGMPVLGGCVGHNCRLGSGLVVYPARMIESDVVLFASADRRVITDNVTYEQSDHHKTRFAHLHPRLYPRAEEVEAERQVFLAKKKERERQKVGR
jgi:carbonic anhydrase/acetyltransferase-like protein (isoleucine patch superfamily)